jgi:hypothetical protein
MNHVIEEMKSAKLGLVSRGDWSTIDGLKDGIEILFEDYSDSPFCLYLTTDQFDRLPATRDRDRKGQIPKWSLKIYTSMEGEVLEIPARYRLVKRIPWLKPWSDN